MNTPKGEVKINKEKFWRYESVRRSGITNMFAIRVVMKMAELSRDEVLYIMSNYRSLLEGFKKPMP